MNRLTQTLLAGCIAMGATCAMAQAGGSGGGGGGGPGLNSTDSSATPQKPMSGNATAPAAGQGDSMSGGNMSSSTKANGGAMSSGKKSTTHAKKGTSNNTQGTGQMQTPSPQ